MKPERNGLGTVSFPTKLPGEDRRTFTQRQSQSTVMAQEKITAELMNVEHSKGKMTSGILMQKKFIQSRSNLSKG